MKVSVLFCFHPNDEFERLEFFMAALEKFPSQEVPVFILCKEDQGVSHYNFALTLAQSYKLPVQVREVPAKGFDLGAYRNFMLTSDSEIFVLLSSSSTPTTYNWVEKLVNPILENRAVITGSMVSTESLNSNFALDLSLGFLKRTHFFKNWLPVNHFQMSILQLWGTLLLPIYFFYRPMYTWKRLYYIPKFPNLHLRTTGVAVTKSHYLKTVQEEPRDKIDAFLLESGKRGLSIYDSKSGLVPYLVTTSDEYRLDQAYERNFRKTPASLPMIIDKHFKDYNLANVKLKRFLEIRTWGHA